MVATSKLFSKDVFIDLKKKIPESNQKHRHLRSCSAISEDTVPYSVNLSISVGKYKKVSNSQLCLKPLQRSTDISMMMRMLCPLVCKKNVHLSNFF